MMTPDDHDPDALVPVAHAASEFEAQTKAAILRDAGIECVVFAGERSWLGGASNQLSSEGVPVLARRREADAARRALTRQIEDSVDLDWETVDVGEPDAATTEAAGAGPLVLLLIILGVVLAASIILAVLGLTR